MRAHEMDALDVPVSRDHSINATARLTLTYALRHSNRYDTHHRASCPRTSIARRSSLPLLFQRIYIYKKRRVYIRSVGFYSPVSKTV